MDGEPAHVRGGNEVSGIILAGGLSLRMGADKALLEIEREGETLLERTVRVLRPLVNEIIVVGPDRPTMNFDATVVPDEYPGLGPLAGLVTGLGSIACDWAFVTGCDMPLLSPDAIKCVLTAERYHTDGIVPVVRGIPQPLHALYAKRILPVLRSDFAEGGRSLTQALGRLDVTRMSQRLFLRRGLGLLSFVSVDTPVAWQYWRDYSLTFLS